MTLTIQYMSSMIRMRERMKVRRRQQWPSRLNPWLFLQNVFQKIDFRCRDIFIRRLSVFYLLAQLNHLQRPIEMCLWGFFFWKGISSKGIWHLGYLGYDLGSKTRKATSSSPSSISCDIPCSSSENFVAFRKFAFFGHTRTKELILTTIIFTKRVQPCLWLSWLPTWSSGWSEWLSLVKVVVLIVLACVYVGGC